MLGSCCSFLSCSTAYIYFPYERINNDDDDDDNGDDNEKFNCSQKNRATFSINEYRISIVSDKLHKIINQIR